MKHSVAGIAIEKGKVFIARRKSGGKQGGKWEFPGGKVEAEEGDKDALLREYFEEFGVAVEVGHRFASAEFSNGDTPFVLHAYRIFFTSVSFTMIEHTEWRWVTLGEIEALDFVDSDRRLLPALQTHLEAETGINN